MDAVVESRTGFAVEGKILCLSHVEFLWNIDVGIEVDGTVLDGAVNLLEGIFISSSVVTW